jgi:hypothetical protein
LPFQPTCALIATNFFQISADNYASGEYMQSALAAAVLFAIMATTAAADVLADYDDAIISAQIMGDCNIAIAAPVSEGKTSKKLKDVGDAAWHQLWASLDEQNAAGHEDNARRADHMLKQRTVSDFDTAKALIAQKGCPALAGHARTVIDSYRE